MSTPTIDTLREAVRGEVISPKDEGYDEARKVYNGMIDRHPEAVVRVTSAADVVAAVNFARETGQDLSIRGGGHSVPGFGTNDGGLVIDFSRMRGVRVDPKRKTARAEGGATWGDFNHATHAYGLATTGGIISSTGVSGLTLGGGIGYLTRAHGLSCDNLLSADVVTADGKILQAGANENEDLYWALRGGGGNFGVVTSLEFKVHPVGTIFGGPIVFAAEHGADVLEFYRDWIAKAPGKLGAFFGFHKAPPLPFLPEEWHGKQISLVVVCWTGDPEKGEKTVAKLRKAAPVVGEHVGVMPYPMLNTAFDPLLPPGLQHYWKADFVKDLTDEAIAAHVEHGSKVPSIEAAMHLYPIDGACHKLDPGDTAFAYRDARFAAVIAGMWPNPADNEANTRWVREYWSAIHPHAAPGGGGYVNFMAGDDQERIRDNYKGNYDRLLKVKRKYDPANLFHMNQNIKP